MNESYAYRLNEANTSDDAYRFAQSRFGITTHASSGSESNQMLSSACCTKDFSSGGVIGLGLGGPATLAFAAVSFVPVWISLVFVALGCGSLCVCIAPILSFPCDFHLWLLVLRRFGLDARFLFRCRACRCRFGIFRRLRFRLFCLELSCGLLREAQPLSFFFSSAPALSSLLLKTG